MASGGGKWEEIKTEECEIKKDLKTSARFLMKKTGIMK